MILHGNCHSRPAFVEDIPKVEERRCEGYCIYSKHAEDRELDGEHLIRPDDLNGNPHRELLVLVLGRHVLILLHEILLAVSEYGAVRPELEPYLERASALYVAERGVKLQILLETPGEEELQFHGLPAPVVQDDFLAVELLVDEHVQVVLGLRNVDGNVHALAEDLNGDRLAVVLVVQEEGEGLPHRAQLVGHEGEGELRRVVALDVICTFELYLCQEIVHRI